MGIFKRIAALLSDRYVLITKEEWSNIKISLNDCVASSERAHIRLAALSGLPTAAEFQSVRSLAEQACILCEGILPDSGISARKVGNLVVTTGTGDFNQG